MIKPEKINQTILDIILISILVMVPLIFTANFYNSFRLLKTTIFISLVSLALIFAILVYIKKNISFWKKYKTLLIILGGFFIFKITSFIFSVNHHKSFWGGYSKLEGILTWSFYIIFFLILAFNFINKKKRNIYLVLILITSFIITLFGFLQHYGYIGEKWSGNVDIRPIGTLGNPIHLGALMIFTIPLSIYGFFNFKSYAAKGFAAFVFFCQILNLMFTKSRSSWAAFTIGVLIVLFLYFLKNSKNKKWLIIFSIISIIFITSFIYIGNAKPDLIQNKYIQRAFSIFDKEDLSNKQRIYFWQGSWRAFAAKPWFGWGEENLNIGFDRNYPPKLTDLPETRIDRAHNIFLDVLVEEGIFAFFAFMAFFAYILYLSFKLFFDKEDKEKNWIGALGIFFVIGYGLQYFFMYPVISSYIIIFFVFSQVVSMNFISKEDLAKKEPKKMSSIIQYICASPAAIIFLLILIWGTLPRISANYSFTQSMKQPQNAEYFLNTAYKKWPSPHLRARLSSHYLSQAFSAGQKEDQKAEEYFKKAKNLFLIDTELFPDNYISQMNLASIYNVYGDFETSDKYFIKAVNLTPTRHDVYWTWAENMHVRREIEKTIGIFLKAIKIDSEVALPYYKLSEYYLRIGEKQKADEYLQIAKDKDLLPRFIKTQKAPKKQISSTDDAVLSSQDVKSE